MKNEPTVATWIHTPDGKVVWHWQFTGKAVVRVEPERTKAGVFFAHTGLLRQVLQLELGKKWKEYTNKKLNQDFKKAVKKVGKRKFGKGNLGDTTV